MRNSIITKGNTHAEQFEKSSPELYLLRHSSILKQKDIKPLRKS